MKVGMLWITYFPNSPEVTTQESRQNWAQINTEHNLILFFNSQAVLHSLNVYINKIII